MAEDEEKYIRQSESDQIAKIRRERQLAALRAEEASGIATALNTTEEIAAAALELGFDSKTAPILQLIPMIQVAWADGRIQESERRQVLDTADARGLNQEAFDFLTLLLNEPPSKVFFDQTNRLIASILADGGSTLDPDNLLGDAQQIASAAGGLFGLGAVSAEERALLEDLQALLKNE